MGFATRYIQVQVTEILQIYAVCGALALGLQEKGHHLQVFYRLTAPRLSQWQTQIRLELPVTYYRL
jgi:hypothetical protein